MGTPIHASIHPTGERKAVARHRHRHPVRVGGGKASPLHLFSQRRRRQFLVRVRTKGRYPRVEKT